MRFSLHCLPQSFCFSHLQRRVPVWGRGGEARVACYSQCASKLLWFMPHRLVFGGGVVTQGWTTAPCVGWGHGCMQHQLPPSRCPPDARMLHRPPVCPRRPPVCRQPERQDLPDYHHRRLVGWHIRRTPGSWYPHCAVSGGTPAWRAGHPCMWNVMQPPWLAHGVV